MSSAYLKIRNISSLDYILNYLKSIENKKDLIVFLDWDDTLVNPDNDKLIEPEITKNLFRYMIDNRIFYAIITGRFYDSVCDDKKRNVFEIQHNIQTTISPVLRQLGVDIDKYSTNEHKQTVYKIFNENNGCVGILYMGIFFSGRKGDTIKNYLRQTNIKKGKIIFVDDYEPYLTETTTSVPNIEAFRRMILK